jgi:prevent-host-death family protein
MTRTISSNEAKQRWGAVISAVSEQGDEVIVESHGKPKVAVISYEEFERFKELREQQRREEAVRRIRALENKAADSSVPLTEDEIEKLSVSVGREINVAVAEKHRLRFGHDSSR